MKATKEKRRGGRHLPSEQEVQDRAYEILHSLSKSPKAPVSLIVTELDRHAVLWAEERRYMSYLLSKKLWFITDAGKEFVHGAPPAEAST